MFVRRVLLVGGLLLVAAACQTNDGDAGSSEPIGDDENNRYQLDFAGTISIAHTGGLICKVEEGNLVMDFAIDASDGVYEYTAVIPAFDPTASKTAAEFHMTESRSPGALGEVDVTFEHEPAPEEFPGVVRAFGTIAGDLSADNGDTTVSGSYACFLQNAEVGG